MIILKASSYQYILTSRYFPEHLNKAFINLIDNEIDLSIFDSRYQNDETGAPAYDPAILLKIILYAYSKGITSSRDIAQCCRKNVIFMALSADTRLIQYLDCMNEEEKK